MHEPIAVLVESAFHIAWDYLERSGELGDPNVASHILLDTMEVMIRRGEYRKLMLANKAIDAYRRYRAEDRRLAAAS
jgi:hypothetical protein